MIGSIAIAWGYRFAPFPHKVDGRPVTLAVWSDPTDDGEPDDAVLLGSAGGLVSAADTDTFVTYQFDPPIVISGNSFFMGFKAPGVRRSFYYGIQYFAGIDDSSSAGKSWVVFNDRPKVKSTASVTMRSFFRSIHSLPEI